MRIYAKSLPRLLDARVTKISLKRAPPPILSRRRHHVRPHNSCPKPLQLNVRESSLTTRNEDYGASRKEEG